MMNTTGRNRPLAGARLGGIGATLAVVACVVPLLLGFVLPAMLLLKMALTEGDAQFGERFLLLSRNSFVLAGITAGIGVLLALLMAYGARLSKSALATGLNRLVGLGYAVPGAVIAVGVPITAALIFSLLFWGGTRLRWRSRSVRRRMDGGRGTASACQREAV